MNGNQHYLQISKAIYGLLEIVRLELRVDPEISFSKQFVPYSELMSSREHKRKKEKKNELEQHS